jgi:hypothetical protein
MSQELPDLTRREQAALHDLTLGIEHLHRAYGHLLAFHHEVGRGMDEFDRARERLRDGGHDAHADRLRDEVLPAGVVGDRWSYEVVEAFERDLLEGARTVQRGIRDDLSDGMDHVHERRQRRRWRQRADR